MTIDEHRSIIAFINRFVREYGESKENPLDIEADAIIRALFVRNPEAAYRVTLLAMSQQDELTQLRDDLAETKQLAQKNWLSRLLKKQNRQQGNLRLDPDFSIGSQNIRSR